MKIKTKLRLGFGFLFVVVVFFGLLCGFYIYRISNDSKVILKDNYETLGFTREMRAVLDDQTLPLSRGAAERFNENLTKEEGNITERGEGTLVAELRSNFGKLTAGNSSREAMEQAEKDARFDLRRVDELNMNAIVRKNEQAQSSVKKATIYLAFAGTMTFLVLFSFIVNFPGFIANPLNELREGIREIGLQNYKRRLNFSTNDEFAELAGAFNQMAVKLDDWENSNLAKIMSEKMRIEAIIEQMQDAIIGLDEKGQVLFINPQAQKLFNMQQSAVLKKNAGALAEKNDLLRTVLADGEQKQLKIFADDRESYFQMEKRQIFVPNFQNQDNESVLTTEQSAGTVYVLRNITAFRELDQAKTNFIATISHELKTPIASILMSINLLKDKRVGELNTEQEKLVVSMKDDNERLLKITAELLQMAQLETGNILLNIQAVNPVDIVNYAIDSIKFQAEQRQIAVEKHFEEKLPAVFADTEKTAWVIVNFLSNALRYSADRSKIILSVKRIGNYVDFSVRDFGKGVEEQYQKRLFDRYFQVPTDGKNKSGNGLGLAISKDFIEAQQGDIYLESEMGAGSKFGFRLPVSKTA
ncbi:PAS domain-containing protein [Pedobacter sp. HMF7647]|uniref:histidine kinase n=1 Tax=Hufsiella arboris TaxID=2695275 RepID=A0A7K1Y7I6_9SPHI|nr:ATP-binding protein [Hufsiella arboris]MXV50516.1 PAS domain-containing protein [Hufsiella arboris]